MTIEDIVEKPYTCLTGETETWLILARPDFGVAFRFGPFPAKRAGELIKEAIDRGVVISLVCNCGTEVDWEMAKDFCPAAKPADEPRPSFPPEPNQ